MGPQMRPIASVGGPLTVALGATTALLLKSARATSKSDLRRCALLNVAWTLGCTVGLTAPHTRATRLLVGATAVFDAVMAASQWRLQSARGSVR